MEINWDLDAGDVAAEAELQAEALREAEGPAEINWDIDMAAAAAEVRLNRPRPLTINARHLKARLTRSQLERTPTVMLYLLP